MAYSCSLDTKNASDRESTDLATAPPRSVARVQRNLDGGSSRFWEEEDLDFGREPSSNVPDFAWGCNHIFSALGISLAQYLRSPPSSVPIECTKCWAPLEPDIELPQTLITVPSRIGVSDLQAKTRQHGRQHGRLAVDTARHARRRESMPAFDTSLPELMADPMEDQDVLEAMVCGRLQVLGALVLV